MKKHIGFLIMNMQKGGGTERVTSIIANELSVRDYKISIISCQEGEKSHFPVYRSVNLYSLHGERISNSVKRKAYCFLKLKDILCSQHIDYMIAVDVALYIYIFPLQKLGYCKGIAWEHFNYYISVDKKAKLGRTMAAKFADYVVVLGKRDLINYKEHYRKIKHIVNIYNPLALDAHKTADMEKKNIIAVGRLTEQKGFDLLIKVWEKVEAEMNDWTLNIYGEGELRGQLQKMIQEKKLRNIHLRGYTDNIEEKYLESSIFALTSRYEGYVLVLIEAQAKGLPCISFDCKEGPSEIIDDGVNGFLIEEGDIEEYSKKLMILMRDISLRQRFSENARKDLEKYDIRNILCEWEKIFYNLGVQKR